MTPQQKAFTTKAISNLRTINLLSSEPHGSSSLSEAMDAGGIRSGFIDFGGGSATGFSGEGLAALAALAKSYRPEGSRRSQQASSATLAQFLSASIVRLWKDRDGGIPGEADFDVLDSAVVSWFTALSQSNLHAVPCTLPDFPALPFSIGPVHFYRWHEFPTEQFGVTKEEFWPTVREGVSDPVFGGAHFRDLVAMAIDRRATWVAVVELSGRAEKEAIATADIAVDIALGVLQIAAPGLNIRNIARATAPIPILRRTDVWASEGLTRQGFSNLSPALTIHPEVFHHVIANEIGQSLAVMGKRLGEYLGATTLVPLLNEAWCNAVYWFHEAIAEALDTVAVLKLETAIEVLFRAEDMSGSKSRIKHSFDALFGLTGSDIFPGSVLTVDQFILNITTARSRIAHGTWPTISTDLPGYRQQQPVSRNAVEMVAGTLLVLIAHKIGEYVKAGETADDTDALLKWVKSQRQQAAPYNAQSAGT
ncbi:hypothetical protein [Mesorhizobium sp. CA5]|uniref:hypothetical protein n=1 Tax=Mesorhizobium sp. CA5 TaxID=2876638 RepID=UPI001CD0B65B|nr:hypothetical protein [Mesorhizobium sp. CA5]MBZ9844051.1 hypothetical protein [Mesorhizobium sp. CA5]